MNEVRFSLAIDVGGTKTLIGVVGEDGTILDESEFVTRASAAGDAVDQLDTGSDMVRVARLARRVALGYRADCERAGAECVQLVTAAVGVPEYVTSDGLVTVAEVLTCPERPAGLFAAEWEACGWPHASTIIESDVRLGALGEAVYGAGRERGSFAYLSIGTGLSSSFVIAGEVWQGARGEAIALGEWPIRSTGDSVEAGQASGNLEQFASGAGIARRYAELGGDPVQAHVIAARAERGDARAREVLESAGLAAGRAAGMLVDVLDPAVVIVGGGLGSSEGLYRRAMDAEYARAVVRRANPPALVTARNGPRSGLLGALAVVTRSVPHRSVQPSRSVHEASGGAPSSA